LCFAAVRAGMQLPRLRCECPRVVTGNEMHASNHGGVGLTADGYNALDETSFDRSSKVRDPHGDVPSGAGTEDHEHTSMDGADPHESTDDGTSDTATPELGAEDDLRGATGALPEG
jgi:hypothetical protein